MGGVIGENPGKPHRAAVAGAGQLAGSPASRATQDFGAKWRREQRTAVLRVPSVVVLGEFNYLLNPAHPDFAKITLGQPAPFAFDTRLKR